jgi:hypothetical protein
MAPLEYLAVAIDDWRDYALLLFASLALHGVLIRRWVVGLFDPLLVLLLANAFSWTIVWFMFLRDDIAGVYVVSFTLAELGLYAGIECAKPARARVLPIPPPRPDDIGTATLTLTFCALVHIAATLAVWGIAGIPLFRESRLGAFDMSGGLGILERLVDSSALMAIFAAVYVLVFRPRARRHPIVWAFLIWYFATAVLSGSKGALLTLGQYVLSITFVYTALRHRPDRFWGGRAGKWLLVVSAVFAVFVLATQQGEGDLGTAAVGLVYRIVSYGDVYIFAYPDATIERLQADNALIGLFGGFLSTFRLFPQELVYPNLGLQFTRIVFPEIDVIVGPNPQHPVFGYHYFGWFAPIFSFVLGLITIAVHTSFYRRAHRDFVGGLLTFMLLFSLTGVSIDFEYSLSRIASLILGGMLVLGPVLLIRPRTAIFRLSIDLAETPAAPARL